MKFDLVRPCKYCPFRNDETRITFQCRERAEEIAETAYRQGFPCHETAELEDEDSVRGAGYHATAESQMCGGFIAMKLREQDAPPSFQDNEEGLDEEELFDELESKVDFLNLPVFESEEEFLEANETDEERETRTMKTKKEDV